MPRGIVTGTASRIPAASWGIMMEARSRHPMPRGTVTGTGGNVGGLMGLNSNAGTITASYATGAVTGTTNVGGLVGNNSGTVSGTNYFVRYHNC